MRWLGMYGIALLAVTALILVWWWVAALVRDYRHDDIDDLIRREDLS